MKNRSNVAGAAVIASIAAALTIAAPADARPTTQTNRLEVRTHYVARPSVLDARFVRASDGHETHRMVRWTMDDGSRWLSPNDQCLGRRHWACVNAWDKAAKRAYFGG